MQQTFRGRQKEPTQNIMVVVNWDLKFTYVLVGWEGFTHDSHILHDAIEREDGFTVSEGNTNHMPIALESIPAITHSSCLP
jgi:hypothetical protein